MEALPRSSDRPSGRIPEFEGLRAVLAWTVVVTHVLISCGWFGSARDGISALYQIAQAAVDVFMLLSGFVITSLLVAQREPWKLYLCRRALRLLPAYWFALALAIALNPVLVANLARLPDGPERSWMLAVCTLESWRWWVDVPLHVTLLHGLAPAALLPNAPFTFLGVAWTLSLEWQFYVLAPVALRFARRSRFRFLLLAIGAVFGTAFAAQIAHLFSNAFLPAKAGFFFVGGLTFFVTSTQRGTRDTLVRLILPSLILALLWWKSTGMGMEAALAATVWILVSVAVHFQVLHPLRAFLDSSALQFLGRISYSTYLLHGSVITLVQAAVWRWIQPGDFRTLLLWTSIGALFGTLAASAAVWRFVELPFQRRGRRLRQATFCDASGSSSAS